MPDSPLSEELPGVYKPDSLNTSILLAIREFEGKMFNHGYPSVNESFRLILFCRQWAALQGQHPLDQLMNAIDITGRQNLLPLCGSNCVLCFLSGGLAPMDWMSAVKDMFKSTKAIPSLASVYELVLGLAELLSKDCG